MKILKTASILLAIVIIYTSCATIISTPKQKINITSDPSGAKIFVNGINTGSVTPAEIKVKRRVKDSPTSTAKTQNYILKKEGYGNASYQIKSKFGTGPFLGNILIGGLIGWTIDGISGSNRKYPNEHHFTLRKGSSSDLLIDRSKEKEPEVITKNPIPTKPAIKETITKKDSISTPSVDKSKVVIQKPVTNKPVIKDIVVKAEPISTPLIPEIKIVTKQPKEKITATTPIVVAKKELTPDTSSKSPSEKNKKYTSVTIDVNIDKSVKGEFPTQEIYDGMYVFPIGIIQGIEIGYSIEIDSDWDLDGTSYSDRDITLIVRNRTGKKIIFNNAMDNVVDVKFTGENVAFDVDPDGKFYREKMGSKCPLYAFALDKENGKYVMEPDEIYEWDYTIYQDAETMVGGMLNRRFKPLWAKSYIPTTHKGVKNNTTLIVYPEINLSKYPKEINGIFSTQKVSLPNKKIETTPAVRGLSQKTALKKENGYTVAFENNNIKVMYLLEGTPKLDKDYGYLVHDVKIKIENVSSGKITNKWKRGKIGWLKFYNSTSVPLHIATYSNMHGWERELSFDKGVSVEYKSKIKMTYFSGELWEAKSFSNRNIQKNHPLVVKEVKIVNPLMASESDFSPKNEDGKTLIHVYGKMAEMIDVDPNYNPNKSTPADLGAMLEEKQNKMAVAKYNKHSSTGGVKLYFDETATVFQSIKNKHPYTFEIYKGGNLDLFTSGSKKITSKKLMKSKESKKFATAFHTKSNIKEGNEVFYLLKYQTGLTKVTKKEYYDFIKNEPYSNPNTYFKVNANTIVSSENKKIAARLKSKRNVLSKGAVILLDEDFSDNSFGWKEVNIKASKYNISDGTYSMNEGLLSQRAPIHTIPNFNSNSDNYIIEASLSFLDNKKTHMKGISLGFSSDSSICYSFSVMVVDMPDFKGNFILTKQVTIGADFGLNLKLLSQTPIYSGTPKSFHNKTNIIKIVKQDNVTKFYVNDEFLAESGDFAFNSSLIRFNSTASSSSVNWIRISKTGTSKMVIDTNNQRGFIYKKMLENEIASTTAVNSASNPIPKTNGKKTKIKKSEENITAKNLKYRRSSLYTLMIYDPTIKLNKTIRSAFGNIDIPSKFNNHNVGPYTILSLTNIKQQENQISNFLRKNDIAKKMVSKWFNRDAEGKFNMDLIAERGLYDASTIDKAVASNMARGNAMLADAGEELINKTFIIVNDLKFIDVSTAEADKLPAFGVKGYIIRTNSYLYRLVWDEETQANFYHNYWTNANNFDPQKVNKFNNETGYKLKFIGSQSAWASLQSSISGDKPQEELIEIATVKAIDKAIGKLERKFEAFRTKTPLVSTEPLAAKIGTKEGLEGDDKFEVLEKVLNPETGQIIYKRVGIIKVDGNNIWENSYSPEEMKQLKKEGKLPKLQYTIFKGSGKYYPGQLIKQIN